MKNNHHKKTGSICLYGFAFFTALFGLATANVSQTLSDYHDLGDVVKRTFNLVLEPEFAAAMPANERLVLNNITIEVLPYADFNAWSRHSGRISIPIGFAYIVNSLSCAEAFTILKPQYAPRLPEYLSYVTKRMNEHRITNKVVTIEDFPSFAGSDPSEASIYGSQRFKDAANYVFVDSLGLVMAHELGHIVMNHKPPLEITKEQSQQQEYDADAYGAHLLLRCRGREISSGILTTFMIFALLEDGEEHNTHPAAPCRIARLCDIEIDWLNTSPEGLPAAVIDQNLAALKAMKKAAIAECGK